MGRFLLVVITICAVCSVAAQTNSLVADSLRSFELQEVIISADKLKQSEVGLNEISIDSLLLLHARGSSFAELMRITGEGQIRSYGSNGLSTPSFRGTGGSHTAILWNGINLQSPLSGQQDLSLLPTGMVDDIKLQCGGSASLYGNGSIGGSIQLLNKTYLNRGWNISTDQKIGSFGNHFQEYQIAWSNKSFGSSTKIFKKTVDNDFSYINSYVRPERSETRGNAGFSQAGFLQQNDFRLSKSQLLGLKVWYQDNEVEIPNSILASNNADAIQRDEFVRAILSWNLDKNDFGIAYKQAYIWHHLNFVSPSIATNSTSIYKSWTNRIETDVNLSSTIQLISGINHTYEKSEVDAFGPATPDRNNLAIFSSLKVKSVSGKLRFAINLREEFVNGNSNPLAPSIGGEYDFAPNFKLGGNISRNYRIPTFNDLYWSGEGGRGNPDLIAETSWNEEVSISFSQTDGMSHPISIRMTLYNSLVDNWILWRPIGGNVWTPDNVKQVWARGIETRISGNFLLKKVLLGWSASYNLTKTTNRQTLDPTGREIDKQLFYTPIHESGISLKASYQNMALILTSSYTGKQYTDGENTDLFALPSYNIFSGYLSKSLDYHSFAGTLRLEVNNVLDRQYENRRGYPLYGRNYSIGLNIQFNNKNDD